MRPRGGTPTIIDIHPGKIAIRGYPIEELIGRVRFPDMIWLMLRGELPSRGAVATSRSGAGARRRSRPHAPSIAIARMAVTCGLPVNGAMASAINVLDDVHGGAGQQCMELYREIDAEAGADGDLVDGGHDRHRAASRRRREDRSRLRPSFPSDRPANRAAVRAGRQGAGRRRRHGTLRRDRPRGRGGARRDQEARTSR